MATCTACFQLWLHINELFKLKMKHLQLSVSIKLPVDYKCHLVTLFFRKPDKNKQKEGRTNEVHALYESDIGGCVKMCMDEWLDECEGSLGSKLDPED